MLPDTGQQADADTEHDQHDRGRQGDSFEQHRQHHGQQQARADDQVDGITGHSSSWHPRLSS
jgi:hypothetical protein